jgi:hypothetical protein
MHTEAHQTLGRHVLQSELDHVVAPYLDSEYVHAHSHPLGVGQAHDSYAHADEHAHVYSDTGSLVSQYPQEAYDPLGTPFFSQPYHHDWPGNVHAYDFGFKKTMFYPHLMEQEPRVSSISSSFSPFLLPPHNVNVHDTFYVDPWAQYDFPPSAAAFTPAPEEDHHRDQSLPQVGNHTSSSREADTLPQAAAAPLTERDAFPSPPLDDDGNIIEYPILANMVTREVHARRVQALSTGVPRGRGALSHEADEDLGEDRKDAGRQQDELDDVALSLERPRTSRHIRNQHAVRCTDAAVDGVSPKARSIDGGFQGGDSNGTEGSNLRIRMDGKEDHLAARRGTDAPCAPLGDCRIVAALATAIGDEAARVTKERHAG